MYLCIMYFIIRYIGDVHIAIFEGDFIHRA